MPQISLGMQQLTKLLVTLMLLCVTEIHSSPRKSFHKSKNSFDVYWNVPTYMCKQYNIDFEPELKNFGITVNDGDKFRGEKILILYDPGAFPAVLRESNKPNVTRNGGIPQKGDLNEHLKEFDKVFKKVVPADFSGLGIIDFEAWRPIFRQNWNDQATYKILSVEYEKNKTASLSDKEYDQKAKESFEAEAKRFMLETIKRAKKLRPNALWGYYGYPYCYNNGTETTPSCVHFIPKENDQIEWLFSESTALYPSVYVKEEVTAEQVTSIVAGRLLEAKKRSKDAGRDIPTHIYYWYRHINSKNFLAEDKVYNSLETAKKHNLGGAIIWGSSEDLKTKEECEKLFEELKNTLGPVVAKVTGKKTRMLGGEVRTWHTSNGKLVPPP